MKKTICAALAVMLITSLLSGCGAEEEAPLVEVSEAFSMPAPTATPEPTPEPDVLTEYAIGGAVMRLPEGFSADVMDDGSFFLTSGTAIVSGSWYDADYFSYIGAEYPETAEAAAALLINAEDAVTDIEDDTRCVVEYTDHGQTTLWAMYVVVTRSETLCWKVEFICPASVYDSLRDPFAAWAELMTLPESMDMAGTYTMTSVTGLFTLELPKTCLVIDDSVTAETLMPYGMTEDDAEAFLQYVRSMSGGGDVVYRADFGAMLTVTVDPDAGFTQAEMPEREDTLSVDPALEGADYTYEGMVLVGDNPNLFYLVRVNRGGADELGFTTAHDETGASITFSFAGFTDDEARDILETLVMPG